MINSPSEGRRIGVCCFVIFIVTFLLFSPSLRNDFLVYLDDDYVTENGLVKSGVSLKTITEPHGFQWHPVTTLSHQVDYALFGLKAGGHRAGNLLLHALSAALCLSLVWRMTRSLPSALIVAALFAWHPLRVESVVWIAERKNLLCIFFWLLTLHAYLNWAADKTRQKHLLVVAGSAVAMTSSPTAIILPFSLLLLDHWPLRRIEMNSLSGWKKSLHSLVLEKVPVLLMSALLTVITISCQAPAERLATPEPYHLIDHVTNALGAYGPYLWKLLVPLNLSIAYSQLPGSSLTPALVSSVILAVVGYIMWQKRETHPALLFGFAWFLLLLLPLNFLQSTRLVMADRNSYLPSIGIFLSVTAAALAAAKSPPAKKIAYTFAGLTVLACIAITSFEIGKWRDSETLFRHALSVSKNNYIAHAQLGAALAQRENLKEAAEQYQAALAIYPSANLYYETGCVLLKEGKPAEAEQALSKTLKLNYMHAEAHFELALALTDLDKMDDAEEHLRRALAMKPSLEKRIYIPPAPTNSLPRTNGPAVIMPRHP